MRADQVSASPTHLVHILYSLTPSAERSILGTLTLTLFTGMLATSATESSVVSSTDMPTSSISR